MQFLNLILAALLFVFTSASPSRREATKAVSEYTGAINGDVVTDATMFEELYTTSRITASSASVDATAEWDLGHVDCIPVAPYNWATASLTDIRNDIAVLIIGWRPMTVPPHQCSLAILMGTGEVWVCNEEENDVDIPFYEVGKYAQYVVDQCTIGDKVGGQAVAAVPIHVVVKNRDPPY